MANQFIPYGRQHITTADIEAVVAVLQSDFLTQGNQVPAFEKMVADYTGAKFGVAVNSATSALHMACLALGLGQGDWLWTTPITFVASANCGLYCGAKVDFVDIDPKALNMSVVALEEKLKLAKQQNRLPKIVIPVHFTGEPCDMAKIHELSKIYGFKIIEDASHAIGGKYGDKPIGSCQYSDITVFSFHPVKIITTAEGGLATTNDKDLAEKMQLFRSHGITREADKMVGETHGGWYYQQIDLGFNYRMTELQGALGVSQMANLNKFVARRHELAKRYDELLKDLPIILPYRNPNNYSGLHLYPIQVKAESGKTRKQVFDSLREQNIGVNVHYIPVHTQPFYAQFGFKQGDFSHAEQYYAGAISLPLYYDLTDELQEQVVKALTIALGVSDKMKLVTQPKPSQPKPRIVQLDYLRGLLAFGIMVYHYLLFGGSDGLVNFCYDPNGLIEKIGVYGVAIFYILSGLTLFLVYQAQDFRKFIQWQRFFVRRCFRILPLFAVLTLIEFALLGRFTLDNFRPLLLNMTGLFGVLDWDGYVITGGWSIGNELSFYLIFPLLMLVLQSRQYWFFVLFWLLSAVVFVFFAFWLLPLDVTGDLVNFAKNLLGEKFYSSWSWYIHPANQVFLFLSGMMMGWVCTSLAKYPFFQQSSTPKNTWQKCIFGWLLAAALVGLIAYYPYFYRLQGDNFLVLVTLSARIILTLLSVVLVWIFYQLPLAMPKWLGLNLALLGEISYGVYLIHPFMYRLSKNYIAQYNVMVLMAMVATLVVSYLSYRYYERFFMNLGKKIVA